MRVHVTDSYAGGYLYSGWQGWLNGERLKNCCHFVKKYDSSQATEEAQKMVNNAPVGSIVTFNCHLSAGVEDGKYIKIRSDADGWLELYYEFDSYQHGAVIRGVELLESSQSLTDDQYKKIQRDIERCLNKYKLKDGLMMFIAGQMGVTIPEPEKPSWIPHDHKAPEAPVTTACQGYIQPDGTCVHRREYKILGFNSPVTTVFRAPHLRMLQMEENGQLVIKEGQ